MKMQSPVSSRRRQRVAIYGIALVMIAAANPASAFAFESARWAIGELCAHLQGNLGALLMTAAGVGAVISAAMGNFRASYGLIIVGIGAFSVSTMMELYFEDAAAICEQGAQNGGGGNQGGNQGGGNQGGGNQGGGGTPFDQI